MHTRFVVRSPSVSRPSYSKVVVGLVFFLPVIIIPLFLLRATTPPITTCLHHCSTLIIVVALLLLFCRFVWKENNDDCEEAIVEIMPLGVQLSTYYCCKEGQQRHIVQFLPRETIENVIIVEVVLSYKVYSSVMFRIANFDIVKDNNRESHWNGRFEQRINQPNKESEVTTTTTTTETTICSLNPLETSATTLTKTSAIDTDLTIRDTIRADDHFPNLKRRCKPPIVELIPAFGRVEMTYVECEQMWHNLLLALFGQEDI